MRWWVGHVGVGVCGGGWIGNVDNEGWASNEVVGGSCRGRCMWRWVDR